MGYEGKISKGKMENYESMTKSELIQEIIRLQKEAERAALLSGQLDELKKEYNSLFTNCEAWTKAFEKECAKRFHLQEMLKGMENLLWSFALSRQDSEAGRRLWPHLFVIP
jgi:hypothetical protein